MPRQHGLNRLDSDRLHVHPERLLERRREVLLICKGVRSRVASSSTASSAIISAGVVSAVLDRYSALATG